METSPQTRPPEAPVALRAGIDTFVFDLDDTLYPRASGLHELMRLRVVRFIEQLIGCEAAEAAALHAKYYALYGTSLIGLNRHHGVQPADFLSFVHDIDISGLARCAVLEGALAALPGRRIVFTNGSAGHARRLLDHLGIAGLFDGVCDIETCRYVGKPARAAYETMMARHDVDPRRAVMFDDRAINLLVPHEIGMQTVLIGAEAMADGAVQGSAPGASHPADHVHFRAPDLAAFLAPIAQAARRSGPA